MTDFKVGDKVTAVIDNRTPDGLKVEGVVSATNVAESLVAIDTQFGIRIWVKEADVKPVDDQA